MQCQAAEIPTFKVTEQFQDIPLFQDIPDDCLKNEKTKQGKEKEMRKKRTVSLAEGNGKNEENGCPWLSPPGMPAEVEISEATYNELYVEVVKKAWQKAAGI